MAEALEGAGMWKIKEYIQRHKAVITDYTVNNPIYEMCMGSERIPGSSRFMWWWDQYLNPGGRG